MAAVVQTAINPKTPQISHPMNCLDHQNNLVSNWEASLGVGPFFRATGDLLVTTTKVHLVKAMVFPVVMYGCEES